MEEQIDSEAKDMLMQFMGQTYGELHKLDSFIVGSSQQLQPKSEAFKQTVANVTRTLNSNVPVNRPAQQVVASRPYQPTEAVAPDLDTDQMEFGFDDSVTAMSIDRMLTRIEDKIDRLNNRFNKVLEQIKN